MPTYTIEELLAELESLKARLEAILAEKNGDPAVEEVTLVEEEEVEAPKGDASGPPRLIVQAAREGEWGYTSHPFMDEKGVVWTETNDERTPWVPFWTKVPGATRQSDQVAQDYIAKEKLWDRNHYIYGEWVAFKQPDYDCSGEDLDAKAVIKLIRATYDEHKSFDYDAEKKASDYRRNAVRTDNKVTKRRKRWWRRG